MGIVCLSISEMLMQELLLMNHYYDTDIMTSSSYLDRFKLRLLLIINDNDNGDYDDDDDDDDDVDYNNSWNHFN